jgi:F-type H+-transporting ATPase subunit b
VGNPLTTVDPGLYIWTIATFMVLVFLLKKFAWGPLLKALDERQKTIAAAQEDTRKAREQLERAQQDSAKIFADARVEEEAKLARVRTESERFRQELRDKAAAEAATITKNAERQIQHEAAKAVETIRRETVVLSVAIASKLLRRQVSAADQDVLLQEALKEIGRPTQ